MSDWKSFEANVVDEDWTEEAINYCKKCPNQWVHGVFHNCYTEGCQAPDALMGKEGHQNIHEVLIRSGMQRLQDAANEEGMAFKEYIAGGHERAKKYIQDLLEEERKKSELS